MQMEHSQMYLLLQCLRCYSTARSSFYSTSFDFYELVFMVALLMCASQANCSTDPGDVTAINSMYKSMGQPPLPKWVPDGGDPCTENWQGVTCNGSSIESIILNAANLGGELGDNLGAFSSIKKIDLSNNHISGNIPSVLPITLQNFFLSDNNFTGNIPPSLSFLSKLTDISLNDNFFTGEMPNSFDALTGLINLDFSNNNLIGSLPRSMENLFSLTTLHLQNNQLSDGLVVLQNLSLQNLNIENNLFSGNIPDKLLDIPIFRSSGNHFNSIIAPAPSLPPLSSTVISPASTQPMGNRANQPSSSNAAQALKERHLTMSRVIWILISGVLLFVVLVLGIIFSMGRYCRKVKDRETFSKRNEIIRYKSHEEHSIDDEPFQRAEEEVVTHNVDASAERQLGITKLDAVKSKYVPGVHIQRERGNLIKDHDQNDFSGIGMTCLPSPPPHHISPSELVESTSVLNSVPNKDYAVTSLTKTSNSPKDVKCFTIGFLQQHTGSFSEENLIGSGILGTVYRTIPVDGKVLAVKKLDKVVANHLTDDGFFELVYCNHRVRHANVVEFVGYCSEHGHRLLIHEYCCNGTLYDALHSNDEAQNQLSWHTRVQIALGAARALWYLHEICEPPVVHRNFKSANVLLDDKLSAHLSDCGLETLISSRYASQLSDNLLSSAHGYHAPEFESGMYTCQSDVYSFGVVMLELLTGLKSYDRGRSRGDQFLVRWATPQLHDIDSLSGMVDPALNGQYPAKSLSHFADVISRCIQREPEFRPAMSEVVQDLIDMIRKESPH